MILHKYEVFEAVCLKIIIILIFLSCIGRFIGLEKSPPGFYIDESDAAVNAICLQQLGVDRVGKKAPLFPTGLAQARLAPTYIYFAAGWTKIFGTSITSFRSITAFFSVLLILGLFLTARLFIGPKGALFVALAASLSPWNFQFSRIAWQSSLMPCFLIWGIYFFLRSNKTRDLAAAGVLLIMTLYTYQAGLILVFVLFLPLLGFKVWLHGIEKKPFGVFILILGLLSAPLVQGIFSGNLTWRLNQVSILSSGFLKWTARSSLWEWLKIFFHNFALHFDFQYLFLHGDRNLRHSPQFTGELGWVDMFAVLLFVAGTLGAVIFKKKSILQTDRRFAGFFVFACAGFLSGIVPAALTWESLPHALRSIGAAPFLSLISGMIFLQASKTDKLVCPLLTAIAVIYFVWFSALYFSLYPRISESWFDHAVKVAAVQAKNTGDWSRFNPLDMNHRYYLIAYRAERCKV